MFSGFWCSRKRQKEERAQAVNKTSIQWTDFSANPLQYRDADGNAVWACIHKSTGCIHCYAEALAKRYGRGKPFTAPNIEGLTPFLNEKELHHMLTYKPASGKRCFVGDMTDIFGEWVPFELLDKLFAVFALRPDVTFQILTKRPERMRDYLNHGDAYVRIAELVMLYEFTHDFDSRYAFDARDAGLNGWPLPNVWLGTSCENQETADERVPLLLQTPATVRFVSYEPAIGPLRLNSINILAGHLASEIDGARINWVIIGGESGPKARPFNIQWARDVVAQCGAAGVPVFVKQLGSRIRPPGSFDDFLDANPTSDWLAQWRVHGREDESPAYLRTQDSHGGDPSEWPEDLRVREFPEARA